MTTPQEQGTTSAPADVNGNGQRELDPVPAITVLGTMDKGVAIRMGWRKGTLTISVGRLKFLQEDLGLTVNDDPSQYIL